MTDSEYIREVERLTLADNEVLVVKVKGLLTEHEMDSLHRNLRSVATRAGWGEGRIVVIDTTIELTVVKAEQIGMKV